MIQLLPLRMRIFSGICKREKEIAEMSIAVNAEEGERRYEAYLPCFVRRVGDIARQETVDRK